MARLLLIPILVLACTACAENVSHSPISEAACDAALAYVRAHKSDADRLAKLPIAVTQKPEPLAPSRRAIEQFLHDNPDAKDDPQVSSALAAAELREVSVVENCPGLRSWLDEAGILHDDKQIDEITSQSRKWPLEVLAMSAPVLSPDGKTAEFYSSEHSGVLSGALYLLALKKTSNGRWVLSKKVSLTVS